MHRRLLLIAITAVAVLLPVVPRGDSVSAATLNPGCSVGSLRRALRDSLANPGPRVINLAAGCVYRFADVESAANDDNALPVITADITINGNGATFDRRAGAPDMRYLDVTGGSVLTLNNLTLRHGSNPRSDGLVPLAGYTGHSLGGALRCTGVGLSLTDVTFEDNVAEHGGAVFSYGCDLTLLRAAFNANRASDGNGGAVAHINTASLMNGPVDLHISASVFGDNQAARDGGALFASTAGITVSESTFHRNVADRDGGGLWAHANAFAFPGNMAIEKSTVSRNAAGRLGGGLYVEADAGTWIREDSIWNNTAGSGGGIAWLGLGTIILTTISGNTASGQGGGFYSTAASVEFNRVTLADNLASGGGAAVSAGWGNMVFTNTLLGHSKPQPVGGLCNRNSTVDPLFTSSRGSLAEGNTCFTITVIPNRTAGLLPLNRNGGPTRTHALSRGGAARDAGDQAECNALQTVFPWDQRWYPYVGTSGPACDVGAFEAQILTVTP